MKDCSVPRTTQAALWGDTAGVAFDCRKCSLKSIKGQNKGQRVYENPVTIEITGFCVAEKEGFEPSRPFRSLHDFQSCALDQLGDFSIAVSSAFPLCTCCLEQTAILL